MKYQVIDMGRKKKIALLGKSASAAGNQSVMTLENRYNRSKTFLTTRPKNTTH